MRRALTHDERLKELASEWVVAFVSTILVDPL